MTSPGKSRGSFVAGLLLGILLTAFVAYALRFIQGGRLVRTQQEVADFAQHVKLGDDRSDVERNFAAREYRTVHLQASGALYTVEGERGVGAEGWVLLLEFERDVLVAKRFRTHDGYQPPGSRDDVVARPGRSEGRP